MVRKLHIRESYLYENALNDLRKYTTNDDILKFIKRCLLSCNANIETIEATPIEKPNYTRHTLEWEFEPNTFIVGINSTSDDIYSNVWFSGFNRNRIGTQDSMGYRDINDNTYENCDKWFILHPEDLSTYRNIEDSHRDRLDTYTKDTTEFELRKDSQISKLLYNFETYLNNSFYRMREYERRAEGVRAKRMYVDIKDVINDTTQRIKDIDFGHPIIDSNQIIDELRAMYSEFKSYVDTIDKCAAQMDEADTILNDEHLKYSDNYTYSDALDLYRYAVKQTKNQSDKLKQLSNDINDYLDTNFA